LDLREHAKIIVDAAIKDAQPDFAVKKTLCNFTYPKNKLVLIAIGKAAWQMANAAVSSLSQDVHSGAVITKYEHSKGPLKNIKVFEAGHPVLDQNTLTATEYAISLVQNLSEGDTVLFLISGGGSALFEKPFIDLEELKDITKQMLSSGASINEINIIRKRLSAVKGGRFAKMCMPASVYSIILSDVLGDKLDTIASGPAYPDSSTFEQVLGIVKKYNLELSDNAIKYLRKETPKQLSNVTTQLMGSVKQLCLSAKQKCEELGYRPIILTSSLCCTARDAGSFFASIAKEHASFADMELSNIDSTNLEALDIGSSNMKPPLAFIAGGETVVKITGNGLGGRNQEIALSYANEASGINNAALISVGSDGTDGPTDAAGGFCDGKTKMVLEEMGINIDYVLDNNDSYNALKKCNGLVITGPTGTNVNDLTVLLIK
jgi:glycerate 2-kinase